MDNRPKVIEESIPRDSYAGKAVTACRFKARSTMGEDLVSFELVDIASFMLLNNKFSSKGIFITDENKEECYIKIIETGQESDIADLEKFILLKDKINNLEGKKQEYENIIHQLKILTDYNDEAAVNSIVEEYLRK